MDFVEDHAPARQHVRAPVDELGRAAAAGDLAGDVHGFRARRQIHADDLIGGGEPARVEEPPAQVRLADARGAHEQRHREEHPWGRRRRVHGVD